MRLFTTLFEIAKLPLIVAKDTVLAPLEAVTGSTPFSDTRRQCEKIDEEVGR